MGTFHHNTHELHGITVVVDTHGDATYVGRCHDINEAGVMLHDVAEHRPGAEGLTRTEFLRQANEYGIPRHHAQLIVPSDQVSAVTRFGEVRLE